DTVRGLDAAAALTCQHCAARLNCLWTVVPALITASAPVLRCSGLDSLPLVQRGGSLYPVLATRARAKARRSPAPHWVLHTAIGPARCCALLMVPRHSGG